MKQFKICENRTTAIYLDGHLICRSLSTKSDRKELIKDGWEELKATDK
jgi:hypothetical protein